MKLRILAIIAFAGCSRSRPAEVASAPAADTSRRMSSVRIRARTADGSFLPEDYALRFSVPVAALIAPVSPERGWDREVGLTVRPDGQVTLTNVADDSISRALAEKISSAAAAGAFLPLPALIGDSLPMILSIVHTAEGQPLPGPNGAYFEFQVDKPVRARHQPRPAYPAELLSAGRSARVLVQFVVREDGSPDLSTFKVLLTDYPPLTPAIRDAVAESRFTPAELRGRKVSQVVQQPFTFDP